MTHTELTALTPLIITAATACLIVVALAIRRSHTTAAVLALAGLILSFESILQIADSVPVSIAPLLEIDRFALVFWGLILIAAAFVTILTWVYLRSRNENREELYALILLATLGSMVLAAAADFIALILGLETLTVALYVMIGYFRTERLCIEAAVKYLILAAASSAFLLLGMALIYFHTGTMAFTELAAGSFGSGAADWILIAGLLLFLVGAGFKLGVVPFHMWTPDVYAGAPAPMTAFISTVSKSAMVAVVLRFFASVDIGQYETIVWILTAIAVASMIAGNLLALMQRNLKRILAYSSIAHLGYVLVGVIVGGVAGVEAIVYYLFVYSLTLVSAFGVVAVLSPGEKETFRLDDYRGMFWRRPGLSVILTIAMLSLAGIPLTAGFISKFLILSAGVGAAAWTLAVTLIITSAVGLFYYLRVVAAMLNQDDAAAPAAEARTVSTIGRTALTVLAVAIVYFGIFPSGVLDVISSAVRRLTG